MFCLSPSRSRHGEPALILLRLLIYQTLRPCPTGADSDAECGEGRTIDLRVACPAIKKPESEGGLTWERGGFFVCVNRIVLRLPSLDALFVVPTSPTS